MSVLERRPPYRESNKESKERQKPILGVRFTEVSVKRKSTVYRQTMDWLIDLSIYFCYDIVR